MASGSARAAVAGVVVVLVLALGGCGGGPAGGTGGLTREGGGTGGIDSGEPTVVAPGGDDGSGRGTVEDVGIPRHPDRGPTGGMLSDEGTDVPHRDTGLDRRPG
jgi:hypothetical protein